MGKIKLPNFKKVVEKDDIEEEMIQILIYFSF